MTNSPAPLVPGYTRRIPIWIWFAVINVVVVVVIAAISSMAFRGGGWPFADSPPNPPILGQPPPKTEPKEPPTTAEVVAEVQDGVVLLTCYGASGNKIGFGTGFVTDSEGLVTTNFHVLRGASTAEVEFHSREKFQVKGVRAWDMATDLAILELTDLPKDFSVLKLSSNAERPDAIDVIAIGHPQEFKFTTTTGILSAVRKTSELPIQYRQLLNAKADDVWLQTNAVISGGSSGGPLLDRTGGVIGINTWVSGNYSFAIDVRHLTALKRALHSEAQALADLTGPDERFARLLGEFQQKAEQFNIGLANATSEAERQELSVSKHPAAEYAPRLYDLAVECENAPIAYDCLHSLCQIAGQRSAPARCDEVLHQAADRLSEKYADDPRLVDLMWELRGSPRPGAWHLMQQIGEASSTRDARAIALFCSGSARMASTSEAESAGATGLLEEVVEQYPDVIYHCADPRHPQHLLADEAKELLYRISNLSVGRPAMEIRSAGLDGAEFKLSDYRGKVVILDFWADWCRPCQEMWRHERKLVEDLKDAPFALVGVFRGPQPALQQLVDNKTVTWPNWVDDTDGPISAQWRVTAVPMIYVLDHTGVIRHKAIGFVPNTQLSAWVHELLAKAPKMEPHTAP